MVAVLHTMPVVEPEPQHGWQLTFWLGEASDFSIPFRANVEEIATLLGEQPTKVIELPPYSSDEDFVEGTLRFGSEVVGIYYEYSLGYLSLNHEAHRSISLLRECSRRW